VNGWSKDIFAFGMWSFGSKMESTDLELTNKIAYAYRMIFKYALESSNGIRWNIFCQRVFFVAQYVFTSFISIQYLNVCSLEQNIKKSYFF